MLEFTKEKIKEFILLFKFGISRPGRLLRRDVLYRIADFVVISIKGTEEYRPVEKETIYFNISRYALSKNTTGIQRVVKNILTQFDQDLKHHVVLVGASVFKNGFYLMQPSTGKRKYEMTNMRINPTKGDVFLNLDYSTAELISQKRELEGFIRNGCRVITVVYDVIPYEYPQFFPEGVGELFRTWILTLPNATEILVNSEAVKFKLEKIIEENKINVGCVSIVPLGFESLASSRSLNSLEKELLDKIKKSSKSFIMVGTIEPRKGHSDVIDVFDSIWEDTKEKIRLTVLGRPGWKTKDVINRIKRHKELNSRLFWLKNADDNLLLECYKSHQCVIMASIDEGCGLPIIEACSYGKPVIARDIPVFREVGQGKLIYFKDKSDLKKKILGFDSKQIVQRCPTYTWKDTFRSLSQIIRNK